MVTGARAVWHESVSVRAQATWPPYGLFMLEKGGKEMIGEQNIIFMDIVVIAIYRLNTTTDIIYNIQETTAEREQEGNPPPLLRPCHGLSDRPTLPCR